MKKEARKKLPAGWEVVNLSKCTDVIESGSRPKGGVKNIDSGIPSLGAEHIGLFGTFNFSDVRFISKDFYSDMKRGKIRIGDILLVKDGATTGRVAFVNNDFPFKKAAINEHVFLIRLKDEFNGKLISYVINSPLGQKSIEKSFHGAAQGGITQTFADEIYFSIPQKYNEQISVLKEIEFRINEIEKMRQAALNQKEAISAMQSAILRETFPYKEGDKLPQGWRWEKLSETCFINPRAEKGFSRGSDELTSFVPMEAIDETRGKIAKAITRKYSEISRGYTFFMEGDILFAKITPCMQNGKSAIAENLIDGVGFGSTEFHVLRPKEKVIKEWIYYFVRTQKFRKRAENRFKGSAGQQRVPSDFMEDSLVPLPSDIGEQKEIVKKLKQRINEVEKMSDAVNKKLEATGLLQGAVLREVFDFEEKN